MDLKFFDKLSQNFTELLLNDKVDHSVIIGVKNEKTITAHYNILKYRSSYFRKVLENVIPNENKNVVETRFIFDFMLAADKFELDELSKKLETLLTETKASWSKTYFSLVYYTIFEKQNFKDLENFCNNIVSKYPNLIFDAEDQSSQSVQYKTGSILDNYYSISNQTEPLRAFTSLPESALVSLLKRDDLQIKIWIVQNLTVPTNIEEWTKENFLTLKTNLQQCLPHSRYFHISSKDTTLQENSR
ncbi:hypothetical protein Glove_360g59 [Diversispora epigaea]|uniref:BTB domain-containing protein n=1 Tax=Diversispora epigaea TaxID=1348612 RepID=A0A397HHH2_9GLOM|nr:hypothetical protein Glove_360g59 [Diversispora epigaea]